MKTLLLVFILVLVISPHVYSETIQLQILDDQAHVVIEDGIDENGDLVKAEAVTGIENAKKELSVELKK